MSSARETYTRLRCTVCDGTFVDVDEFGDHLDGDEACPGGAADA